MNHAIYRVYLIPKRAEAAPSFTRNCPDVSKERPEAPGVP
jgi:hypothetical protein